MVTNQKTILEGFKIVVRYKGSDSGTGHEKLFEVSTVERTYFTNKWFPWIKSSQYDGHYIGWFKTRSEAEDCITEMTNNLIGETSLETKYNLVEPVLVEQL